MTDQIHKVKAREIKSWVEGAVFDMTNPNDNQVRREREAEENYNDVGTMQDILADKIFDAATELCGSYADNKKLHNEMYIGICIAMKSIAHNAMRKALDSLIARHA